MMFVEFGLQDFCKIEDSCNLKQGPGRIDCFKLYIPIFFTSRDCGNGRGSVSNA
jgi:hypothetical protein